MRLHVGISEPQGQNMEKIILGKTVHQWFQVIQLFSIVVFAAVLCWFNFWLGVAFVLYELVRSVCMQIQNEEKLIAEFDKEQGN
jgi:hypothetical protein